MEIFKKLWQYAILIVTVVVALILGGCIHTEHQETKTMLDAIRVIETGNSFIADECLAQANIIRYTNEFGIEQSFYCSHIEISGPYATDYGKDGLLYAAYSHHGWYPEDSSSSKYGRVDMSSYDESGDQIYYHYYYSSLFKEYYIRTFQLIKVGDQVYERECIYDEIPHGIDVTDPNALGAFLVENPTKLRISDIPIVVTDAEGDIFEFNYTEDYFYTPTPEPTESCCSCESCCCDPDNCTCTSKKSD